AAGIRRGQGRVLHRQAASVYRGRRDLAGGARPAGRDRSDRSRVAPGLGLAPVPRRARLSLRCSPTPHRRQRLAGVTEPLVRLERLDERARPRTLLPGARYNALRVAAQFTGPRAAVVLDVKFMEWAASQALDTAKLKAAKVPIFGKWYFPEIPAGVPLVNLRTGEVRTFERPMLAGEILWAPEAELRRAGFWPPKSPEELAAAKAAAPARPTAGGVRPEQPTPAAP